LRVSSASLMIVKNFTMILKRSVLSRYTFVFFSIYFSAHTQCRCSSAQRQGLAVPLLEALEQRVDVLALVDGHEHLVQHLEALMSCLPRCAP